MLLLFYYYWFFFLLDGVIVVVVVIGLLFFIKVGYIFFWLLILKMLEFGGCVWIVLNVLFWLFVKIYFILKF